MSELQFCPHCGQRLELSTEYQTAFCPYCGKPIGPQSAEPEAAPVLEEKIPVAAAKKGRVSAPARGRGRRGPTLVGWYLAVLAWALCFGVLLWVAEETDMASQFSVLLPLVALASFPIWFPRFHPWRRIPEKRRGVWLRWSVIRAVLLVVVFLLVIGL